MIAPVVKSIRVRCTPEHAFHVFTAELDAWWPLSTHSLAAGTDGAEAVACAIEPEVGGRWYEVWASGEEHAIGSVTAWDPPRLLAVDWNPSFEERPSTRLEVRFEPDGDGTLVELTHSGWELLGGQGSEARASYQRGWDRVLEPYLARLSS
jgi:uncharacterized protein YndB with AHSA1/START domain